MSYLVLLSVINWLHLFATAAWIGGMATNILVLLPSARMTLEPPVMGKLMGSVMKRFRVLVYISIVILAVTGVFMTRSNANYAGLLNFNNFWAAISLIKHIVVAILIVLAIYAFEGLGKKVTKLAAKGPSPDLARLQKKQIALASIGFILGLIILLLTGIMTAISATS